MLKLYSDQRSGNCFKLRLLFTQLDIPFEVVETDVVNGEQKTEAHRQRNPNAKVPVVEFDDGTNLSESGAILFHFAQGSPLWPRSTIDRSLALQWMFFEQYSHEPYIAVARYICLFVEDESSYREALVEKHERGYHALDVMEQHLAENRFFVGDNYSIADIALYAYTHVARDGEFDLGRYAAIRAWTDRVAATPGYISLEHVCPVAR